MVQPYVFYIVLNCHSAALAKLFRNFESHHETEALTEMLLKNAGSKHVG